MKLAHRQSALIDVEYLMFSVGGTRLAAPVDRIVGVVSDLPGQVDAVSGGSVCYRGREIPLLRGEEVFQVGTCNGRRPGSALIFRHGQKLFAVAVDDASDVLKLTPGDTLYRFPPEGDSWNASGRPWGYVEMGDAPVFLVNLGPLRLH
jgi:chemotaxis signal transduction protein